MINDIFANMFLSLIFEKYCSQNKQRKRSRMFNHRDRRKRQRKLISISIHLSEMLIAGGLF